MTELSRLQRRMYETQKPAAKRKGLRTWLGIAAGILFLVMATALWKTMNQENINWVEYQTAFGKTEQIELLDGSRITLNANSHLRFAENFADQEQRKVWLDGEAFFEVEHLNKQPFIVHTDKGEVRVLGTSFNVAQRKESFEVALIEGKVQVHLPNEVKINLQPGKKANVLNQTVDVIKIDTTAIAAWRHDQMNFKNISVARIIEQIEVDCG